MAVLALSVIGPWGVTTEIRLIKRGDSRTIPRLGPMRSFCSTLVCCLSLFWALPEARANTEAKVATEEATDEAPSVHAPLTVAPVPGQLSSEFGLRSDPVRHKRRRRRRKRQRMHKGLDFIAQRGTHVHAAGRGVVLKAQITGGYGRLVVIDHGGGVRTRYAHLQRFKVRKGQSIDAGTVVGDVGSSGRVTGPHLHFEVRVEGEAVPPADVVEFTVPKCSRRSRACKSIDRASRKDRPNS